MLFPRDDIKGQRRLHVSLGQGEAGMCTESKGKMERAWLRATRGSKVVRWRRLLALERVSTTPGQVAERALPSSAYRGQRKKGRNKEIGRAHV